MGPPLIPFRPMRLAHAHTGREATRLSQENVAPSCLGKFGIVDAQQWGLNKILKGVADIEAIFVLM